MLNFPSPEKILLLAILALVVLGPSRLPQAARTAGKWIGELRKLTSRFQDEMSGALAEPKDAITAAVGDLRNEVGNWRSEISGLGRSLTTAPTPEPEATNGATNAATNGSTNRFATSVPSGAPSDSVSTAQSWPGLPSLPPVPDDPSLN